MKYSVLVAVIFMLHTLYGQEGKTIYFDLEADVFHGSILEHNPDIAHLITHHPQGLMLAYNKKSYGVEPWERRYNYPDVGYTFIYQDMKNPYLGELYSLYSHYNFYFWNRRLQFRIGQGFAIATKPYDKVQNFINNAYGTRVLSSTMLKFVYKKDHVFKNFGVQAGATVVHYSNANLKAPNNSTNTFAFTAGINYVFDAGQFPKYIPINESKAFTQPIHYNIVLRGGVNESDINNSGRYGFVTVSAFADKRINRKSALQLGCDAFFANFLKTLIAYEASAFPDGTVTGNEDWKRVGVFVGHELFISKMSFVSQLGYYIYYPYDFEGKLYNRIGLKRYLNDKTFLSLTVKSHGAKAEGVEFGAGLRL